MDLSTAFLGSMNVNTDMLSSGQGLTKAEPSKASGQRFDSYYDSYRNNRQDNAQVDRSKNVKSDRNVTKRQNVSDNKQAAEDKRKVTDNKDKNVSESKVAKTDDTKETKTINEKEDTGKESDVKAVNDSEKAELEKNILAEVSKALGISEEDLAAIMQELNIQPAQLTQNEDVVKLVQEYLQIEDPAQMLVASNFTDIVSSVGKAVEDAVEQTEKAVLNTKDMLLQQNPLDVQANQAVDTAETVSAVKENAPVQDEEEQLDENRIEDTEVSVDAENIDVDVAADVSDSGGNTEQQQSTENMFNTSLPNSGANMPTQQTTDSNVTNVSNDFANMPQNVAQAREVAATPKSEAAQRMETVIQQIADKIKVDIKFDSREMNLVLKPESLGSISLKLVSENGGVTAQFVAESQRAKEIIEANMSQLKDTLQQQGINVNQLSVEVGSDSQSEQMQQFLQEQAKSGRRIDELLRREGFGEEVAAAEEENTPERLDESVGNSVNYQA